MDPKRCLKCQGVGINHNAADCKSIHDVCARCAEMHRTDQCTVESLTDFRCANCKAKGHGAADRECPIFKERMKVLHDRIPNYAYRFFPMKDPSTWERNSCEGPAGKQGPVTDRGGGDSTDTQRQRRDSRAGHRTRDQGWPTRGTGNTQGTRKRGENAQTTNRLTQYRQTSMDEWNRPPSALGGEMLGSTFASGAGAAPGESWADGTERERFGPHSGPAQGSRGSQSYPNV
jgi:hypothetical protein